MITSHRKSQISKLADFVGQEFSDGKTTLLDDIALFEEVNFYFDSYEDAFDGLLLYDNYNFHIHINTDSGNLKQSKRGRFTFAHELGHFFLDEHRLGLKYGLLEPHASFHNLNQKSEIEKEADYFSSCLLMPSSRFKEYPRPKKFCLSTIITLSNAFQTSIPSTIIRFCEVGTHDIFAVVSKKGIVQWFVKSLNFPNWTFKFKIGEKVPSTTVVGEYINSLNQKTFDKEIVDVDDWFKVSKEDNRANKIMYEQCYFSTSYEYVISLLWFD